MKIVQVIPRRGIKQTLKSQLAETERRLRGGNTAFIRKRAGRWVHATYPGWINWDETKGDILVAEVQSRVKQMEWQLLRAFIGYLERHLKDQLETVIINYR